MNESSLLQPFLAAAICFIVCGCGQCSSPAHDERDIAELLAEQPRWSEERTVIGFLIEPSLFDAIGKEQLFELPLAWRSSDAPALRVARGEASPLQEDGINSITLGNPERECGPSSGLKRDDNCLSIGQSGVTRLSVRSGKCGNEIVEADILLNQALLRGPLERLTETILHEMGHAFGLPHVPQTKFPMATILREEDFGVARPTDWDQALLDALYRRDCE